MQLLNNHPHSQSFIKSQSANPLKRLAVSTPPGEDGSTYRTLNFSMEALRQDNFLFATPPFRLSFPSQIFYG
jgi:hypothetical protein